MNSWLTEALFEQFIWYWMLAGVLTFILLRKIVVAPFGRHTRTDFGPMINNRLGWMIMESVSFFSFLGSFYLGQGHKTDLSYFLALLWAVHYFNRSFIYPFRQKDKEKQMPVLIMTSAIVFNVFNGFINGYFLGHFNELTILANVYWFIPGAVIFATGMYINFRSDRMLLSLRRQGEKKYYVPRGFLFKYISCPNHFGEIIEWIGFAFMSMSMAGFSFALWTIANLAPRSLAHHKWYLMEFPDYPDERKALIPFVW